MDTRSKFELIFPGSLITGAMATVVSNSWNTVYHAITDFRVPVVSSAGSARLSSILPLTVGGWIFCLLQRYLSKGRSIWQELTEVLTPMICIGEFAMTRSPGGGAMPEGSADLTVPIDLIAGHGPSRTALSGAHAPLTRRTRP
jgi:hypothetical protein